MKILVTGANGFIGAHTTKAFRSLGHEVYEDSGTRLNKFDKPIDVIFHLAAITKTFDIPKNEMFDVNYEYPKSLFNSVLKNNGCKRFIFTSSTAVYGDLKPPHYEDMQPKPLNFYAESKLAFENYLIDFAKRHNVNATILRYCNVYGTGESKKGHSASVICQLIKTIKDGKQPALFKHGEQKRDWLYVEDCVKANQKALTHKGVDVFNIGTGLSTSFNDLLITINKCLGTDWKASYISNPFESSYQNHTQCDITKAKTELGFVPSFTIKSGIKDYLSKWNN